MDIAALHLREVATEEQLADWIKQTPEDEKRRQHDEFMRERGLPTDAEWKTTMRQSDKLLN